MDKILFFIRNYEETFPIIFFFLKVILFHMQH